jgi:hypothetical protein
MPDTNLKSAASSLVNWAFQLNNPPNFNHLEYKVALNAHVILISVMQWQHMVVLECHCIREFRVKWPPNEGIIVYIFTGNPKNKIQP